MFEDFLSCRLPPDGKNIIDDYLAHRGWRESVAGRRYLQQLRDSVLSLYEVIAVSPGYHCDLVDLVRDRKPIRVHEHMGTQNMVKWDRIAARVLEANGKHYFSGGILPFSPEQAQSLLKVLEGSRKRFNKEFVRGADRVPVVGLTAVGNADDLFLYHAAPAFTSVWITLTLEQLHAPMPELVNRDCEVLLFTETRFPVLAERLDEISQLLDSADEWERDHPDQLNWTWLEKTGAVRSKRQQGLAIGSFQGGQRPISGSLEVTPRALILTTNSMERTERAISVLEKLLRGPIGPALSKIQTPEQLMAEHKNPSQDDANRKPADPIDPEIAHQVINNMLDQHYRESLDEPILMLGNKTPRQCARSKNGREKVIAWLKYLENSEHRRAASQGQKPYDSSWIWGELNLRE